MTKQTMSHANWWIPLTVSNESKTTQWQKCLLLIRFLFFYSHFFYYGLDCSMFVVFVLSLVLFLSSFFFLAITNKETKNSMVHISFSNTTIPTSHIRHMCVLKWPFPLAVLYYVMNMKRKATTKLKIEWREKRIGNSKKKIK